MKAVKRQTTRIELTDLDIRRAIAEWLGHHQTALGNLIVSEKQVYLAVDGELRVSAIYEFSEEKDLPLKKI